MAKKLEKDPQFEQAWALYPRRPNNNKRKARKAWDARLREGYTSEEMIAGVEAYVRYVEAENTEPRFIKHTATFFGPDAHFLNDLAVPDEEDPSNEGDDKLLEYYQEERLV